MEIWESFVALLTGLLTTLYGLVGSYGIAIIAFTIVVRVIFLPLSIKSTKSMRDMQQNQAKLKPQLDALKKKYGNDRQRLMEEQTKLYKELGINPMSGLGGCLPMLIQMPIWIGLYSALFRLAGTPEFGAPFLWIENLGHTEGMPYILTAFTGLSQFAIARMTAQPGQQDDQQKTMNTMMQFMMPAMMVWFATQVPAGLVLYWAANNVFQFFQQLFTTGWGQLWPSRAKVPATPALAPAVVADSSSARRAEVQERERETREAKAARKATRQGSNGDARDARGSNGAGQLPDSAVEERDGLRIYTLEPEDDGADFTADGSSRTTEESIARARGQQQSRAKRKKRRL